MLMAIVTAGSSAPENRTYVWSEESYGLDLSNYTSSGRLPSAAGILTLAARSLLPGALQCFLSLAPTSNLEILLPDAVTPTSRVLHSLARP